MALSLHKNKVIGIYKHRTGAAMDGCACPVFACLGDGKAENSVFSTISLFFYHLNLQIVKRNMLNEAVLMEAGFVVSFEISDV